MEERLDDAINVLRSHCEPQLNLPIGMDATSLSGHSSFVPTAPQSQSTSSGLNPDAAVSLPLEIPVKVERTTVPSASSEFKLRELQELLFNSFKSLTEKRKEPPDSDTKPSSSSVSGTAASKANGQKRQRR